MARRLGERIVALAVALAIALGVAAYFVLPSLLVDGNAFKTGPLDNSNHHEQLLKARNDVRTSALALLTFAGLVTGAVLTWRTVRVTRDGQMTDRLAGAAKALGSDQTPTQIGALYALEGVARSSRADYKTAIRLVTHYLRSQAGTSAPGDPEPASPRTPPEGLNEAVGVLGRRNARRDNGASLNLAGLDLRNVDLTNADLRRANLSESNLSGAFLQGCRLDRAKLTNTRLLEAHLDGASFKSADLTDANFDGARVDGANFRKATFRRTSLANLHGAARGLPSEAMTA